MLHAAGRPRPGGGGRARPLLRLREQRGGRGGPSSNADLAGLVVSTGVLTPGFDPATTACAVAVGCLLPSVRAPPTAADAGASMYTVAFVRAARASRQVYIKASNTEAADLFGWSVGVSGDTVVVGAPSEAGDATGANGNQVDVSAPDAGAARVIR